MIGFFFFSLRCVVGLLKKRGSASPEESVEGCGAPERGAFKKKRGPSSPRLPEAAVIFRCRWAVWPLPVGGGAAAQPACVCVGEKRG